MTDSLADIPPEQVLATITPSAPRRIMGIVVLCTLGTVLVYLGVAKPPAELVWQVFLLVLGGGTLYLAEALRHATANSIELTAEVLRESSGRVIAQVEDIVAIDRGAFAIKPSNGFRLRLVAKPEEGNRWAPGLWWRLGRHVGVGGITSSAEAKTVAEILAALAVARHAEQAEQARSEQE